MNPPELNRIGFRLPQRFRPGVPLGHQARGAQAVPDVGKPRWPDQQARSGLAAALVTKRLSRTEYYGGAYRIEGNEFPASPTTPHSIAHGSGRNTLDQGQEMLATTLLKRPQLVDMERASAESVQSTSTGRPMLETRNLSRAVADKALVDNVNVQVQRGEVLAVIGPSGAGKSSFLRLLNRLDEPTGGTVLLNGEDYRRTAPRALRRRVGIVMQTAYLFPGTVAENIAFGPRQHGEKIAGEQIAALLERVGLPGYGDRDVNSLSGGEAQRVSVARTLANAPEALLLDEPTSSLDEASARGIEELVLGIIKERQLTCVIVTHNRSQAARIAGRTMVLEAGRLVAIGPTGEMLHAY